MRAFQDACLDDGSVCEKNLPHGVHAGAMQRFNDTEGYNARESNVLRMLGYFSLIGLQRVHTLVGDYHGALQAIYPLNLFEVGFGRSLQWRGSASMLFDLSNLPSCSCSWRSPVHRVNPEHAPHPLRLFQRRRSAWLVWTA